jgi:hypothetical protein
LDIKPSPVIPIPGQLPKVELGSPNPESATRFSHRNSAVVKQSQIRRHLQIAKFAQETYEQSVEVLQARYHSQHFGELGSLCQKQLAGFSVMETDGHAVIAFRGTVLNSWHNWKTDFQISLEGTPPRHHGFDRAWRAMEPDVRAWLAQRRPLTITLTGHSLGGAIATLAAFDLVKDWSIAEVVVFGCPKVGSDEFAIQAIKLAAITTRYVKTTDLFARVPWDFLGYCHVGTCEYVNEQGEQLKPPQSLLERTFTLSELQDREQPKPYGILGRLGIDFTPKTSPNPVKFYGLLDLLTRLLPGWGAILFVLFAGLAVDGFRHPMKGYMALLQRRLNLAAGP